LKANDHRILGQDMDLFSFNDVAPGSVFWHHNGLIIYNELINFMRKLLKQFEYKEISTPQILSNKLWKVSGHWEHFKENMFLTEYENKDAAVKPMNCPAAMLIYKTRPRSYKELPLRFAEFGIVHRKELSGVLAGLFRVVKLTMDDAHIFCSKEQIESEISNLFKIVKIIYKDTFNFPYTVELSTRPNKFMGDKKEWDFAEEALSNALKKSKIKYKVNKGDGAFYGPKIDVHIKDSLDRSWQVATIQLDMQMPQRFELKYTDKDNKEKIKYYLGNAANLTKIINDKFDIVLIEKVFLEVPSLRKIKKILKKEKIRKKLISIINKGNVKYPVLRDLNLMQYLDSRKNTYFLKL
ncbi:hypothetical protein LCGC14_2935680, partial [marine sediment metagenome]